MWGIASISLATCACSNAMCAAAGCFERIIVLSPSVHLDSAWQPVKRYVHTIMGVPEEEQCFFDTSHEEMLSEILETQRKVVEIQKKEKAPTNIYGICLVVDDVEDSPQAMSSRAGGYALNHLLVHGRHIFCSCMILRQKMRAMGHY